MEAVDGRSYPHSGLCTGWLDSLTGAIQGDGSPGSGSEAEQQLQALTVNPPIEVCSVTNMGGLMGPIEVSTVGVTCLD